jgi:hypothetical protein
MDTGIERIPVPEPIYIRPPWEPEEEEETESLHRDEEEPEEEEEYRALLPEDMALRIDLLA